jgi:hypothetical protein
MGYLGVQRKLIMKKTKAWKGRAFAFEGEKEKGIYQL